MEKEKFISTIEWEGISIQIIYIPNWFVLDFEQAVVSHIELRTSERIPVTETGYRSIFFNQQASQILPSVHEAVRALLDESAESKEWQAYAKQKSQLRLF